MVSRRERASARSPASALARVAHAPAQRGDGRRTVDAPMELVWRLLRDYRGPRDSPPETEARRRASRGGIGRHAPGRCAG
jgi:hypothetical protein